MAQFHLRQGAEKPINAPSLSPGADRRPARETEVSRKTLPCSD